MSSVTSFVAAFAATLLLSCQSRPVQELALADVAIRAAQKVKADALAPDLYRKAENNYLRAKKDYVDGYFESSKRFATQARLIAEQAEYRALLKQTQISTKSTDDTPAPVPGGSPGSSSPGGSDLPM